METPARAVLITFLCCSTSRLGLVVVGVTTISCLFCSSSFLCLTVGLIAVGIVVVFDNLVVALAISLADAVVVVVVVVVAGVAVASA